VDIKGMFGQEIPTSILCINEKLSAVRNCFGRWEKLHVGIKCTEYM
jgi:hypothetical protein